MTGNQPSVPDREQVEAAMPLIDLPLFWRGRAQALRILDKARTVSDEATLTSADAYAECAAELTAALSVPHERVEGWPEPKILNPDIPHPTGKPYIDCLLHRLLDAQQDLNLEANESMSQPVADASLLIDEVERAIRKLAAAPPPPAPEQWRTMGGGDEN